MAECSAGPEVEIEACLDSSAPPRRLGYLVLALIVLGVALRVRAYVHNPALWLDEAALAVDLRDHPLALGEDAVGRMRHYPLAFLAVSKLSVSALGGGEYVLRLFPFLSALAGLGLFYALAKRCLKPNALAIAVCLFAVSPRLVRHAAEAKPYSSDVAVVTGLGYLAFCSLSCPLSIAMTVLLAVAGAGAVWLSFPAAFCLAGFGTVMGLSALAKRQWGRAARLCAVGLTWTASFGAYYVLGLREMSRSSNLVASWQSDFVPLPPDSWSDLEWLVKNGLEIFHYPGGLALPGLAAFAFCVGFLSLARRRRAEAFALVVPMGVTLLASGLHLYPFAGRLLLFCLPLLYLLIAEGTEHVRGALSAKARAAGMVLMLLLLAPPCARALKGAIVPRQREEIRPVLAYVAANRKAGDTAYVYCRAVPAVGYYADRYGLRQMDIVWGASTADNWDECAADLDGLRGRGRTWIVFSHIKSDGRDAFLGRLDGMGTRRMAVEAPGAAGYLYDLREGDAPAPPAGGPSPDSD